MTSAVIIVNVVVLSVYLIMCVSSLPTHTINEDDVVQNFTSPGCYTNKDCFKSQYCSENRTCVECFDCNEYGRSKSLPCPKELRDCGGCMRGYIEISIKNSDSPIDCLSPPVSLDEVLDLADNPTSYTMVLTPTRAVVALQNQDASRSIQIIDEDAGKCNTDKDCPVSHHCFEALACIKCFDCSKLNRANLMKCAKYSTDCGSCLPKFIEIGQQSTQRAICMRWNSMLEAVWTRGQLGL